jgi:ethylbenzene dioxygenase ferredoxin subunit
MVELIRLCRTGDVAETGPCEASVGDLPSLAVFRWGEDYFVTDNFCTHGAALLSEGYQEGFVIECPLHGGSFDIRDGKPLASPCQVPLRTYPAIVDDGWVAIEQPPEKA